MDMPIRSNRKIRARIAAVVGGGVMDSEWLSRLGRVSFLGTLDHHPKIRHISTRLEHSLSVANLGLQVAEQLELDSTNTRQFVAACLLHDIGHYPFSHAAESAFSHRFGANHHQIGQWIITGTGPIASWRSLKSYLEDAGIDPNAVWSIIDGTTENTLWAKLSALLRGPINLDTLDGIMRVASDFRMRKPLLPERIFVWVDGFPAICAHELASIDEFWQLKNRVYDRVINLPSNILAEARLCDLVKKQLEYSVLERFLEFDDSTFVQALGESYSRARLKKHDDKHFELRKRCDRETSLVRIRKRYFVDRQIGGSKQGLPLHRWGERYRHYKEPAYLMSRGQQLFLPGVQMTLESPEI